MTTATASWFTVDKEGLAKLMERKGKEFVLYELLQNSWDTNAKKVDVSLRRSEVKGYAEIEVIDDHPDGWKELAHAWTLYAESEKKADAEKRGRFNLGEKLVLALCRTARIETTTGGVAFDVDGRHTLRTKRATGSRFSALVRMNQEERVAVAAAFLKLIPPPNVVTTLNGATILPTRTPLQVVQVTLPTETADGEGVLRRSARKTSVEIYEPLPGETASIYELGIPVVETGDRFHYNVCVDPSTKILTGDLRYVEASSINVGDVLVGFDEDRVGDRRHFRKSTVLGIDKVVRPSYRLTFDDGTVVICSEDHQWLTAKSKSRKWMSTKCMVTQIKRKPGTRVVKILERWETDNSYAGGYLAAAFDGEGSLFQTKLSNPPNGVKAVLTFSQNDNQMFDNVKRLLSEDGIHYRIARVLHERKEQRPNNRIHIGFRRDILRFLGKYRPVRLLPKFRLDILGQIPGKKTVRLVKKEFVGNHKVLAIETSTHTFIAEGLASHNCQKVPLNSDRDNVTPAYLQALRTVALNAMHSQISKEDAVAGWVRDAAADPAAAPVAIETVMTHRFGEKRVIADPTDPEGTKLAMSQGYTVVPGGALSGGEWANVKRDQVMLPAGQVTPSPKPYSPDGDPLKIVPPEKYTESMVRIVDYARALARELMGATITVQIVTDVTWPYAATYGPGRLTFNLGRLGHAWFDAAPGIAVDKLLIHEFGHHYSADHLSEEYHDRLCELGGKMVALALSIPEFFHRHGRVTGGAR